MALRIVGMSELIGTRVKDGVTWPLGGQAEVDWITEDSEPCRRITAAIPAVFDAYATLTNHPGASDLPRDASLESRCRGPAACPATTFQRNTLA
jgi:hypothetical protein